MLLTAVAWTGGGDGHNWDDPMNWNTHALPGSVDDVTINIAADVVHSNPVTDSIKSLTSTQPLTLSGGTLSIAGASSTSGSLTISGGNLAGTGDIAVSGPLTLTSGSIAGSGAVNASAGILINPAGGTFGLDGRTLTNEASQTATWTGTGSNIQASNGAVFNNLGTFLAENQGAFTQGSGAASSFIDKGSFTKSTSNGELDFSGAAFSASGGTIDVQTGTLGLQGGGTETGAAYSIKPGATLDFTGTTPFTLDNGTTFSGAGSLIKDGPTTMTIPGNSPTFTGSTTVNAGTLLANGSQPGSAVAVISGSTLGGTGTVGAVTTTGGTVSPGDGPGILNVQGNVTLDPASSFVAELDGAAPGTGFDQLNVNGTVNLNGSTLTRSVGSGFTPLGGESFSIIRSTAAIVGTFQGLPEGANLVIGGRPFKISYAGSGGHNVVLTVIGPAQPPQIISADKTTFVAGTEDTFTVISIGGPTPTVSETGVLPSGVTFVDNADGSATLTGTPAAGSGGVYHLMITASNGQVPSATQSFTLTLNEAPAFTSATATAFTVGSAKTFTVTTSGFPTSTLSETGALPSGVSFLDNGNGTATLAGTPAAGTAGVYDLLITASNGLGSGASQHFTLSVTSMPPITQAPAITSAGSATFAAGALGTFTVTAIGVPTPTLSETGALPPGVMFVNHGDGTATLVGTPAAASAGAYHVTITAANGVGTAATQDFTFNVAIVTPPKVLHLQRYGVRLQPTRIVLTFDEPMNPYLAQRTSNYVLRPVIHGRVQTRPRQAIRVASAVYNPVTQTVSLKTAKRLNLSVVYQITVNGTAPLGLANVSGVLLDGKGNGVAGSNLVMSFTGKASLKGIALTS